MSNAYRSLRKSGKFVNQSRQPLRKFPNILAMESSAPDIILTEGIRKSPEQVVQLPTVVPKAGEPSGWEPPAQWSTDNPEEEMTTETNFKMRHTRVKMTIPHLLSNVSDLHAEPDKYLYDIKLMRYLSSNKHNQNKDFLQLAHRTLYELGLPELVMVYWNELKINKVKDMLNVPFMKLEIFYHMLMALWFQSMDAEWRQLLCDKIATFCIKTCDNDGFKVVFRKVKRQADSLKALLGILYQFAKHTDDGPEIIRNSNGSAIMDHVIKGKFNYNVKTRATLVLSYILTEQEQKSMNTGEENIDFLLKLLSESCKNEGHRSTQYNYTALEVVEGLNQLAVSDNNKSKIFYGGIVNSLRVLLNLASPVEEQEEACKSIWTLAFNTSVREELLKDESTTQLLRDLTASPKDSVRMAAGGALWTLEQTDGQKQEADKPINGHIMISYNWAFQSSAIKLKDQLQESGYSVWVDVANMSGSTLAAMSDAVEKAAVVLILFSEKYKISPACRAEAEYTYRLRKDFVPVRIQTGYVPDGWLGMLMGTKLFYDLSIESKWDNTFLKLCEELGERGKGPPITSDITVYKTTTPTPVKSGHSIVPSHLMLPKQQPILEAGDYLILPSRLTALELQCRNWSSSQVSEWITNHGIESIISRIGDHLTGHDLAELKNLQYQQGEEFVSILKHELSLTFFELLKLGHAVRILK